MKQGREFFTTVVAAIVAGNTGAAIAQSAQEATSGLDEVVVTAERVEENLQDTPVSVLQVSGQQMYDLGVENVAELAKFMPNVSIGPSSTGGEPQFSIRGVSQIRTGISGDRSVGFYVDGQYFPRTTGSLMKALDIANVEVLRGPQGTLFGRNNTGGAISITTQKPGSDLDGRIRLGLGDFNRRDINGVANIPITDNIAFRGSLASYNRDGYVEGENGQTRGDVDDLLWRAAFRFDMTDNATLDLAYTDVDSKKTGFPMNLQGHINPSDINVLACQLAGPCPTNPGQFVSFGGGTSWVGVPMSMDTPYTDSLKVTGDPFRYVGGDKEFNNSDTRFVNTTINWHFAKHLSLRSITGAMKINTDQLRDSDATPWPIGRRGEALDHESWSQELHLIGDGYFNDRFKFISGLYGFGEKNRETSWSEEYGTLGFLPFGYTNSPGADSLTFRLSPGQAFPFLARTTQTPQGPVTTYLPPGSPSAPGVMGVCPLYYPFAGTLQTPQPLANGSSTTLMGCIDATALGLPPRDQSADNSTADSWAIFTDATFAFTDKFSISAGLRYTKDKKTWLIDGASSTYGHILGDNQGEWHSTDWRFVAQYRWTPSVMTYFNISKAYKAGGLTDSIPFGFGGFGVDRVANGTTLNPITGEVIDSPFIPYDPESVINHEIGLRSEWFDHRFRANISIFSMDYDDKQQEVFIQARRGFQTTQYAVGYGSGRLIINASKVIINGLETELTFAPTNRLTLALSYAHLNAHYDELDPILIQTETLTLDTPLPRAPKYSYTFQVQYRHKLFGGFGSAQLAYAVNGKQYSGAGKNTQWVISALGLLNARIDYSSADRTWTAGLYARNLANKFYLNGGFRLGNLVGGTKDFYAGGTDIIFPGQPREVGLDFTYNFGK